MMRVLLFSFFILLANLTFSQRIPLSILLEARKQNSDSIQSLLLQNQYDLVGVTEPINGKIATGIMKFQFTGNKSVKQKQEYYISVHTSPNLDDMYNSDNMIELDFSDTEYFSILKSEIKLKEFSLVKTTFSDNVIKNYYYKQYGPYKMNGEFLVLISYTPKSLPKGKSAKFSFQITTSSNCRECLKYALEN